MFRTLNDITALSHILKRRRLAIAISIVTGSCGGACPFNRLPIVNGSIEKHVVEILRHAELNNEITCIISLCKTGTMKNIALCSSSLNVSKNRYDEALKCISFSDTLLIIASDMNVVKLFANLLCLAQLEGVEAVLMNIR
jgi:hypothetical protein